MSHNTSEYERENNEDDCIRRTDERDLIAQITAAKTALEDTLMELDEITLQINPQIKAEYEVKIGYLETELFKAQLAARRAKRKVTIAQASINAGAAIDENLIESTLKEEFDSWQNQLDELIEKYYKTLETREAMRPLSPSESRELKTLHRALIKRLHPDLHPLQTEKDKRLFQLVQSAYGNGDLDALRSLDTITGKMDGLEEMEDLSEDELYLELDLVSAQLNVSRKRLEEVKHCNPYALREKLSNDSWIIQQTEQLKSQIEKQRNVKTEYEKQFILIQSEHSS